MIKGLCRVPEAMGLLKENSTINPAAIDTLESTVRVQMADIIPNYGRILSYEFVLERTIKDFVSKRFYIVKFDKHLLKVDFTLYNNGKEWRIINFNYDENLIEILY
ncbi:MAG: hypothetical protein EOP48_31685 [Sphingobacteriales bacterium]|nr:MAG: hypothetical protein EOP48_31685 [Sphingobacteriales bacterium]